MEVFMTEKLFEQDAYLKECDAKVVKVEAAPAGAPAGARVWLDRTVFFGFAGGQQSDSGTIDGKPVLAVAVEGDDIVHTLPEGPGHSLSVGQSVKAALDWVKRYRLMRMHSATHIVAMLTEEKLGSFEYFGSSVSVDKGRLDILWQENLRPLLPELEAKANAIVKAAKLIRVFTSPENPGRFIWECEGLKTLECCGTHVKNSSEVGAIKLNRSGKGAGKERIEVLLEA